MTLKSLIAAIGVAVLATSLGAANATLPDGWLRSGSAPACQHGVRAQVGAPTVRVFFVDCPSGTTGFATLMQQVSAKDWAGHRVRVRAQLQTSDVQGWAGVWMRADEGGRSVAFDNMQDRALHGSTDWRSVEVVLDVPAAADTLSFGFLAEGGGSTRATQFKLETVGQDVATTGAAAVRRTQPIHLSPP